MTTQWVKVADELPKLDREVFEVLIYHPDVGYGIGYPDAKQRDGWVTQYQIAYYDDSPTPTHWAHLIKAPE